MLFNSVEFLIFLPLVFLLYWFILSKNLKVQNLFLIVASYFFYGWWDWRFLSLIFASSLLDYSIGLAMGKTEDNKKRKLYLWISMLFNLGMLGFFKYYNFFTDSFIDLLNSIAGPGAYENSLSLKIILPVGISFYTFQTMSYTIDVYRKKLAPTKDILSFFAFVSFFPQLVAGPIEKASNLLPQFYKKRGFDYSKAVDGSRQMLWGMFKKVVIADNCAPYVNEIFQIYDTLPGFVLLIGILLFCVQIYCDFSGYSDIAIGTARLFGFNLLANFKTPYFATSIADLWRRWHISLSAWANEYIFFPLTSYFKKYKKLAVYLSLVITFTLIGFWHGANWTFVFFGLWHGTVSCIEYFTQKRRRQASKKIGAKLFNFLGWFITMIVWIIGMIMFRADSISDAWLYFRRLITPWDWYTDDFLFLDDFKLANFSYDLNYLLVFFIFALFLGDWISRKKEHGLGIVPRFKVVRWLIYFVIILFVGFYFGQEVDFIYFQF